MSDSRQVKTPFLNILKRIIMWSSCVDKPELHATDDSRQGREEKAIQNNRLGLVTGSSAGLECAGLVKTAEHRRFKHLRAVSEWSDFDTCNALGLGFVRQQIAVAGRRQGADSLLKFSSLCKFRARRTPLHVLCSR